MRIPQNGVIELTGLKLLAELQQRKVNLTVDGKQLRYSAPKGALTDELQQAMKTQKADLLELLRTDFSEVKQNGGLSSKLNEYLSKCRPEWVRFIRDGLKQGKLPLSIATEASRRMSNGDSEGAWRLIRQNGR